MSIPSSTHMATSSRSNRAGLSTPSTRVLVGGGCAQSWGGQRMFIRT